MKIGQRKISVWLFLEFNCVHLPLSPPLPRVTGRRTSLSLNGFQLEFRNKGDVSFYRFTRRVFCYQPQARINKTDRPPRGLGKKV